MRAALWLLALFGVAVAIALFAGNNQGTVTLFWPPYRVDLSLNLVLLLLAGAFVFLHAALRAMAALFDLPSQALRWRNQQKERAMHAAMLDALSQLVAGRFLRSRKSAESALAQEKALAASSERPANGAQIRVLAHLLAAESAQRASVEDMSEKDMAREIKRLEKLMLEHARNLEFEKAASVRDQLSRLKAQLFGASGQENLA